jgi:hypothetical protein
LIASNLIERLMKSCGCFSIASSTAHSSIAASGIGGESPRFHGQCLTLAQPRARGLE